MINFLYTTYIDSNDCFISFDGYIYEGSNVDFLCDILNKNWWQITQGQFKNQGNEFDNERAKALFSLGKNPVNNKKSTLFHLINNYFNKLDFQNLYPFIEDVLLENTSRKLTTRERAWVYKCFNNDSENYFDFEKIKLEGNLSFSTGNFSDEIRAAIIKSKNSKNLMQKTQSLDTLACRKNLEIKQRIEYKFENFSNLVCFIISDLIKNNITIKKCACCEKYFYPPHRVDTLYCNNYAPDEKNLNRYIEELEKRGRLLPSIEKPLTCPKYMSEKNRLEREKNNKCLKIYRQIYNSLNNKLKRGGQIKIKEKIEKLKKENSKWKSLVKQGKKTENEYLEWLKKTKSKEVALPNGIANWKLQNIGENDVNSENN